jgi:hypothetical protein
MEASVGHGHAIRCDQQPGTVQDRRRGGQQAQLHGPVGQLRDRRRSGLEGRGVPLHCRLIKGRRLPLLDADGPLRAAAQTRPETVAQAV